MLCKKQRVQKDKGTDKKLTFIGPSHYHLHPSTLHRDANTINLISQWKKKAHTDKITCSDIKLVKVQPGCQMTPCNVHSPSFGKTEAIVASNFNHRYDHYGKKRKELTFAK